jgi:hypothetical protein
MRQWLRKHERLVGIAATLLLIAAVASVVANRPGGAPKNHRPKPSKMIYFMDLSTNELLPVSADMLPPIAARFGGECVRAFVWSCGDCSEQGRKIGWLEKYTDQAKQAPDPDAHPGHLIKTVDDIRWFPYADKKERDRIMGPALQAECEEGRQPGPCFPPQASGALSAPGDPGRI